MKHEARSLAHSFVLLSFWQPFGPPRLPSDIPLGQRIIQTNCNCLTMDIEAMAPLTTTLFLQVPLPPTPRLRFQSKRFNLPACKLKTLMGPGNRSLDRHWQRRHKRNFTKRRNHVFVLRISFASVRQCHWASRTRAICSMPRQICYLSLPVLPPGVWKAIKNSALGQHLYTFSMAPTVLVPEGPTLRCVGGVRRLLSAISS
ncbi:hypothetical protein C8R45DRAFT_1024963 [Mycena sanguinolenta]|nr:hypothetical protein C8R45DRAFT_1024963 [Mycena sanguinolenta]